MNKAEAIAAMEKGEKVTHLDFDKDEWMTMTRDGRIRLEDGVICSPYEFWRWRLGPSWETGYSIFKEK